MMGVATYKGLFNKLGCLLNLQAKYDDTKERVAHMSNKSLVLKKHIKSVCENPINYNLNKIKYGID
jgi:hypothetical protein